jgi:hypothetical protein
MIKPEKRSKILSPFMLTLAAMASWAALHEPDRFTMGSAGVWALGAMTVALLVRAGLALLVPLIDIIGAIFGRAVQILGQGGAGS